MKIELNFYFHTSLWCLKRFYEGLKAFIKPFEVPQRSVKIKIQFNFFTLSGIGTLRVNVREGKEYIENFAIFYDIP